MPQTLHDPDKAPHEIVEHFNDGGALRNDGLHLKPAAQNPWYVLATVYGEQTGEQVDTELHRRNRRIWNGWLCARMSEAERAALARQLNLDVEELSPLSRVEYMDFKNAAVERLGRNAGIRGTESVVNLSQTYFPHSTVWSGYVFHADALFFDSTFSEDAIFNRSVFTGQTNFSYTGFSRVNFLKSADFTKADFRKYTIFDGAQFHESAYFCNARFRESVLMTATYIHNIANFEKAEFADTVLFLGGHFDGRTIFQHTKFSANAIFSGVTFSEFAKFHDAVFSENTEFENAKFEGLTSFSHARFKSRVPLFYECTFHQNTDLTTKEAYWPKVTAKTAADSKRAYTRLRQMMSDLQKPDDEHFFHRRELECQAFLESWPNRLVIRAYGWFSDYGYSFTRPSLALTMIILFFWPFYGSYIRYMADSPAPIAEGLGISLSSTFGFLGFMRSMHPDFLTKAPLWVDLISGTQTVLGVLFLFLLGLGLRTRFRMR